MKRSTGAAGLDVDANIDRGVERIHIKIIDQSGNELWMKMKPTTPMQRLMEAFFARTEETASRRAAEADEQDKATAHAWSSGLRSAMTRAAPHLLLH